jgi:hypothetical protein
VTQAVGQMDEVTQQNAALVEEAAAAAESLEDQAQALVRSVAMFRLSGNATNNPVAVRPSVKASVSSLPIRSTAKLQKVGTPVSRFKTGSAANLAEDHWESF